MQTDNDTTLFWKHELDSKLNIRYYLPSADEDRLIVFYKWWTKMGNIMIVYLFFQHSTCVIAGCFINQLTNRYLFSRCVLHFVTHESFTLVVSSFFFSDSIIGIACFIIKYKIKSEQIIVVFCYL